MIRLTQPEDAPGIVSLADEAIGFSADELEELRQRLEAYFECHTGNDPFWLTDVEDDLIGVAYCAPEPMTQGTWNLLFIAVRPDHQGQGRGTALIKSVEQLLIARGARLLLVETIESLEQTRAFYHKCGFEEEAKIRDFYEAGIHKIVYRKLLAQAH